MTYSERLAVAMQRAGYTQGTLARTVGMAQSSINQLLKHAAGSRKTVEIASVLGVRAEWLASGKEPMLPTKEESIITSRMLPPATSNSFNVDVMSLSYSCGPGTYGEDFPDIIRSISLEPGYASRIFGGRPATSIKAINAQGDSMVGTINPEDLVFIDVSVKRFEGDGIYAFTFDKTSHIKRLQKVKNRLMVISDNASYENWSIDESEEEQLFIDGKVIISWPMTLHRFA